MRTLWPAAGLLLALFVAMPVQAADASWTLLRLVADDDMAPLAKVLQTIEDRIPGRALDANMRKGGKRPTYRVKWLGEDGKVREITADARSGKILEVR